MPVQQQIGQKVRKMMLSPAQAVVMASDARLIYWVSARGASKTTAGLLADVRNGRQIPKLETIWFRRNLTDVKSTLIPNLERALALIGDEGWRIARGPEPQAVGPTGSRILFNAAETVDHVGRTQGGNYPTVSADEPQNMSPAVLGMVFAVARSTEGGVPTQLRLLANPGGMGHAWLKSRLIEPARAVSPDGNVDHPDWTHPITGAVLVHGRDWRHWRFDLDMTGVLNRSDVPPISADVIISGTSMNPALNYPEYHATLGLGLSPMMRRAWIEGDVDVVIGQFFPEVASWVAEHLGPGPLDQVVVAIDPGMRKTAAVWGAYDDEQCCRVFDEQFWVEKPLDAVAGEIKARHPEMEPIYVIDPSAESRSLQTGRSIGDEFRRLGLPVIASTSSRRRDGWQVLRSRGSTGHLRIDVRKCRRLIESLTGLVNKDSDPDDAQKDDGTDFGEDGDHLADALRYMETYALFRGVKGKSKDDELLEHVRRNSPELFEPGGPFWGK